MVQAVLLLLGTSCIIAAPLLLLSTWFVIWRMGVAIKRIDPALWEAMRPGMYSDIWVTRKHNEALSAFISTREYLSLNNASITRLATAYKYIRTALVVSLIGAVLTVLWAVDHPVR
jgi:hypothetical protein